MAGGGPVGGNGGFIKRGLWIFFAACVAVAIFGDAPNHPGGIYGWAKDKAYLLEDVATDTKDILEDGIKDAENGSGSGSGSGSDSGGGSTGGTSNSGSGESTNLSSLQVSPQNNVSYDRGEWPTWDNVRTCWTVREQALYRDAKPGSTTLKRSNGSFTKNVSEACEITGGVWIDPYTGEKFTNPSDLDIDHMVPLGEAARSGGQGWSASKKREYANYLGYNMHLIAVSASANRQKSDRTPDEWQPINRSFHCEYATAWTAVKNKWDLTVTKSEKQALKEMLGSC